MQLTREYLTAQLEEAKKMYDQHQARLNAAFGAITTLEVLLKRLDEPEPAAEPKDETGASE
jgi:hypothetical protein